MGSNELGLLPILVSIISLDGIMARETALAILSGTSSIYTSNHMYMLSLELGLVPVLASVLLSSDSSDNSSDCRYLTLRILHSIYKSAYNQDNYYYTLYNIGSKDLGVLPGLVMVLERNMKLILSVLCSEHS